jgi:hypothetical protein
MMFAIETAQTMLRTADSLLLLLLLLLTSSIPCKQSS